MRLLALRGITAFLNESGSGETDSCVFDLQVWSWEHSFSHHQPFETTKNHFYPLFTTSAHYRNTQNTMQALQAARH
jgi:hypothetical protein